MSKNATSRSDEDLINAVMEAIAAKKTAKKTAKESEKKPINKIANPPGILGDSWSLTFAGDVL